MNAARIGGLVCTPVRHSANLDGISTMNNQSIRSVASIFTIAVAIMSFWANPNHLSQLALTVIGGTAILIAVVVLLYDHLPRSWFVTAAPADEVILLGEWMVTKPDLIQTWTFSPGGTVISNQGGSTVKGRWRLEKACVRVDWNSLIRGTSKHHWATLNRPFNPAGTRGDAWDGQDLIHAVKMPAPYTKGPIP